MADPRGFLKHERAVPTRRPVDVRILDWKEVYEPFDPVHLHDQAARCMDCGIPFCHNGCPLGNLIPEWNDLVFRDDWAAASERLHATNNFPEFTGRLCPAPCEAACVLGIADDPVTIKQVEVEIADRAIAEGWTAPQPPVSRTGRSVAVVGSGPAGLAAAQQLTRAGHDVTVLERADRIGGLLRYGIPEFKMEKAVLDRRLSSRCAWRARSSGPVSTWVSTSPSSSCAPTSTPCCSAAGRPSGETSRCRGASWRASTWRWSTSCRPTGCKRATCSDAPISAEGQATW